MPFKSKSQMRTCYGKQDPKWNCTRWTSETPSLCNLPNHNNNDNDNDNDYPAVKSRSLKDNEKIIGPIRVGPRGGRYFIINEVSSEGESCQMKVYIPRGRKILYPKL